MTLFLSLYEFFTQKINSCNIKNTFLNFIFKFIYYSHFGYPPLGICNHAHVSDLLSICGLGLSHLYCTILLSLSTGNLMCRNDLNTGIWTHEYATRFTSHFFSPFYLALKRSNWTPSQVSVFALIFSIHFLLLRTSCLRCLLTLNAIKCGYNWSIS